MKTHLRTHTCGELRISDVGKTVALTGWVQKVRDLGNFTFVDLRDRYGITQIQLLKADESKILGEQGLVREMVLQVKGTVVERESKNTKIPTGEIEIKNPSISILNNSI